jgi:hypothetical protein
MGLMHTYVCIHTSCILNDYYGWLDAKETMFYELRSRPKLDYTYFKLKFVFSFQRWRSEMDELKSNYGLEFQFVTRYLVVLLIEGRNKQIHPGK